MRFVDIIARKRDGHALTHEQLDFAVEGITSGAVPDYQASALLMAITLQGMTDEMVQDGNAQSSLKQLNTTFRSGVCTPLAFNIAQQRLALYRFCGRCW